MDLHIECLPVGRLIENCYIIYKDGREDAVIIDPGAEKERILNALERLQKKPAAVLLTHGHFDHTGALSAFEGLPIYIHKADNIMLNDASLNVGDRFDDFAERPKATDLVDEGDEMDIAGIHFTVLHTPGHTEGCVCYLADDTVLFTGDTLFHHGYGNTEHYSGNFHKLVKSLKLLLRLPKDYAIYPGHGDSSTIFRERGGL